MKWQRKKLKPICGSLVSSMTPKLNMMLKVAMLRKSMTLCRVHQSVVLATLDTPSMLQLLKILLLSLRTKESIKREIIQLPTTDEYKPDYQYMASYSNQKRLALLEKYRVYAKTRIAELGEPMEIPAITQKKWEPVLVSDIFDILSGKRLVAADTTPGDRPFIGALDNSNGIARFVNDTNVSLDKNVLGVNYDGNGMVIGFYHPYECIFSDSVKRFHLKNHEDKAFVLLFMKVAILQQKSKFGYLYKFNAERMANTKIMLPVTDDGAPDYEYMEQYAKNLMLRKYKQYLSYLDSKEKTDTVATDN